MTWEPIAHGDGEHDSAHHVETTSGDTFGGIGTSREVREEDVWLRIRRLPTDLIVRREGPSTG